MAQIKIGLDFHGVIDANPKYFSGFTQEARKRGWKIYVITGGPYEKVKQELEQMNISYDEIFAIYDYYLFQSQPRATFKIRVAFLRVCPVFTENPVISA